MNASCAFRQIGDLGHPKTPNACIRVQSANLAQIPTLSASAPVRRRTTSEPKSEQE